MCVRITQAFHQCRSYALPAQERQTGRLCPGIIRISLVWCPITSSGQWTSDKQNRHKMHVPAPCHPLPTQAGCTKPLRDATPTTDRTHGMSAITLSDIERRKKISHVGTATKIYVHFKSLRRIQFCFSFSCRAVPLLLYIALLCCCRT